MAIALEPTKSTPAGTLDLRELVYLLRNNAGKIVLCVLLAVGGTVFYLYHTKPIYRSKALLEVNPGRMQGANATEVDSSETLKTVEMKLANQSVILAVVRENKLTEDPDFMSDEPEG